MVLGIYGASGTGRELLELARIINSREERWEDFIFIDDGDVPEVISNTPVFTYEAAREKYEKKLEIVVGIGEPVIREKKIKTVSDDGIFIPSLIHPDVYIPNSSSIGKGVVIQYGCFISCDVVIRDYVYLQPQCNISHDDVLEEGVMIAGLGNLGGIVHVGKWTYIGLGASIKQTVTIGAYTIIGMGSTVIRDIPDHVIAIGTPAKPVPRKENQRVFGH